MRKVSEPSEQAEFVAGGPPALRQSIRIPPAFQCPRSGFHGFQCRFQPSPSRSCPRSGVRDVLVDFLLPHPSRVSSLLLCALCVLCGWDFSRFLPRKIFPIVGKRANNFSNHWKNRGGFSNHWKLFFQSLENLPGGGELADCAKSVVRGGAGLVGWAQVRRFPRKGRNLPARGV